VRRALLSRLSKSGKFHADTAGILGVLVYVIQEQGRFQEAEQLQRQVIGIYQGLGYGVDSSQFVNAQLFLATILNLRGQYDAASQLYDQIDVWTAKWEPSRREAISGGLARIVLMLSQGNNDNAVESLSAPTNASVSGLETRASIPLYREDSTPSRLRERVTQPSPCKPSRNLCRFCCPSRAAETTTAALLPPPARAAFGS